MYKKNNKKCPVCETIYTYCPSCTEFEHQPKWRNMWDKSECKDIWNAVSKFYVEGVSPVETRDELLACELKNVVNANLKASIDNIFELAETVEKIEESGDKEEEKETTDEVVVKDEDEDEDEVVVEAKIEVDASPISSPATEKSIKNESVKVSAFSYSSNNRHGDYKKNKKK